MNSIFKKFFVVGFRDLLVTSINLLISIILAHFWDKNLVGVWFSLQAIFMVGDSLFRFKSESVMILRYQSGHNRQAVSSQYLIAFVGAVLVFVFSLFTIIFLKDFIFLKIQGINLSHLLLLIISLTSSVLVTTFFYDLTKDGSFKAYNIFIISQASINFTVIVIATYLDIKNLFPLLIGQVLMWAVFVPNFFSEFYGHSGYKNFIEIKNIILTGLRFHFFALLAGMQAQISRIFAVLYLGTEIVAEVGFIFLVGQLLLKIPAALNTVMLPEASKTYSVKNYINPIVKVIILTFSFICVFYIFSDAFVSVMFGKNYLSIGIYLSFLLPIFFFHAVGIIAQTQLNLLGDYSTMNKAILLGVFTQIGVLFFFPPSIWLVCFSYASFVFIYCFVLIFSLYRMVSKQFLKKSV